ncbi:MAG: LysM peptidoglycan-binding domain-containing protein [Candidatus Aenigmarchaeota archaeon]|nr:LysM peptidoglycan-binding domain-containing protein [Candidatus Aenigmarchaeota archaeon]
MRRLATYLLAGSLLLPAPAYSVKIGEDPPKSGFHEVTEAIELFNVRKILMEVEPGDSLYAIGKRLGIDWKDLYRQNRDKIGDPDIIYPGQFLEYKKATGSSCMVGNPTTF